MKIIFLLNYDIHSLKSLNLLLETAKNHEIKIILSKKVGKPAQKISGELALLKKFEQENLDEISKNLENSQDKKSSKFLTFNQIAKILNCKIEYFDDINSPNSVDEITKFGPNLIISIRFGQILKNPIISIPNLGVINLHSGILPNYRGVLASFWSILNHENEIGTTLHYIDDDKIDKGKIIAISRQKILNNHSLVYNIFSLYDQGCEEIQKFLAKISDNKNTVKTVEVRNEGKYFTFPKDEEIAKFLKIMNLVDEKDVIEIYKNFTKM